MGGVQTGKGGGYKQAPRTRGGEKEALGGLHPDAGLEPGKPKNLNLHHRRSCKSIP
jgi:hypothetical protein